MLPAKHNLSSVSEPSSRGVRHSGDRSGHAAASVCQCVPDCATTRRSLFNPVAETGAASAESPARCRGGFTFFGDSSRASFVATLSSRNVDSKNRRTSVS